jgi:hypothetical protein
MAYAPPPIKPWGKADKNNLQKLIDMEKVDITKTADAAYINQVRHDHFRHHKTKNFRCNFCNYASSREHVDHLSRYCQEQGGGTVFDVLFNLLYGYI